MAAVTRFVRGFGRFWYDFVVGDDPKVAVAVASVLLLGGLLVGAAGMTGPVLVVVLAGLLVAAFSVAMLVDVARTRRATGR
jgi:hypothetical protein